MTTDRASLFLWRPPGRRVCYRERHGISGGSVVRRRRRRRLSSKDTLRAHRRRGQRQERPLRHRRSRPATWRGEGHQAWLRRAHAVEDLLPEFAKALDPIAEEAKAANQPVSAYFASHADKVADALLAITDAKAARASSGYRQGRIRQAPRLGEEERRAGRCPAARQAHRKVLRLRRVRDPRAASRRVRIEARNGGGAAPSTATASSDAAAERRHR